MKLQGPEWCLNAVRGNSDSFRKGSEYTRISTAKSTLKQMNAPCIILLFSNSNYVPQTTIHGEHSNVVVEL